MKKALLMHRPYYYQPYARVGFGIRIGPIRFGIF
jgi:hypothetical protein